MRNPGPSKASHIGYLWLFAAVVAFAAATLTRADENPPANLDTLERDFEKACKNEDYGKALEIAEERHEVIQPKHVDALYDIAWMHCRLGHKDKAYEWLQSSKVGHRSTGHEGAARI